LYDRIFKLICFKNVWKNENIALTKNLMHYNNQADYAITEQFRELAENEEGKRARTRTCWNATHRAIASNNIE